MNILGEYISQVDETTSLESIAIGYCKLFIENEDFLKDIVTLNDNSNNNIAIVGDKNSLDYLTKRLSLICDTGIISFRTNNELYFHRTFLHQFVHEDAGYSEETTKEFYVDAPNLELLGEWLLNCKPLLKTNSLLFLPRVSSKIFEVKGHYQSEPIKFDPAFDAIIKERRIVELETANYIKSKYIKIITKVQLPIIDNASMNLFSKITADEKSQVDSLKLTLRELFLSIDEKEDSETFIGDIEKISLGIQKNIKLISSDFKKLKTKRTFQVSGSSVASIVATLVAIDSSFFDIAAKAIGASGGAYLFFEAFSENQLSRQRIKDNPYYYFWYLEKRLQSI